MHPVSVKVKYSAIGGRPTSGTSTTVMVVSKPPTESEVSAAIKKKHPKWNFVIIEMKWK